MNQEENNYDEIDKMLFEYFDKDNEIPASTKNIIHNAFNLPVCKRKKQFSINNIRKVAILLISFSIMTTSIVFAKDIVNFISKIFTISTKGIDIATENGYVQNVDMDFIFDNNIGIKTEHLVIDESNLDVSFTYYTDIPEIAHMKINEFIIRDEKDNIICFELDDNSDIQNELNFSCTRNNPQNIGNNQYNESILCHSPELPKINSLTFEIISFILIDNNKEIKCNGDWLYTIDIDDNIMKRTTEKYSTSYNKYIKNISTNLSETSLKIELDLNDTVNEDTLLEIDSISLTNSNNKKYDYIYKNFNIGENNTTHLILEFDISKYSENINFLNLFIKYDTNKNITLHLSK